MDGWLDLSEQVAAWSWRAVVQAYKIVHEVVFYTFLMGYLT